MFELTFLGTSSGVPTQHRNVSGLAVECINAKAAKGQQISKKNRPWLLIDCGEATQHQLLRTKLSLHQLKAICITHMHGDHCYGLPGLLASMGMNRRTQPLTLIAPKAIGKLLDAISLTTELHFSFPINFVNIEDLLAAGGRHTMKFDDHHQLTLEVIKLSHRTASHAFVLTQTLSAHKLKTQLLIDAGIPPSDVWGRLQRGNNVTLDDGTTLLSADFVDTQRSTIKLAVAGDNDDPGLLGEAITGATALVHEATYTQAVLDHILGGSNGFDPQHTTAKQIAQFAQASKLPHLILTHFSARYQPFEDPTASVLNMADIRNEVEQHYQHNCILAKDLMQIRLSDGQAKILTND